MRPTTQPRHASPPLAPRPGGPASRLSATPAAPHEPPRGLRLFLRELALGLLDLFYPPRHP